MSILNEAIKIVKNVQINPNLANSKNWTVPKDVRENPIKFGEYYGNGSYGRNNNLWSQETVRMLPVVGELGNTMYEPVGGNAGNNYIVADAGSTYQAYNSQGAWQYKKRNRYAKKGYKRYQKPRMGYRKYGGYDQVRSYASKRYGGGGDLSFYGGRGYKQWNNRQRGRYWR